jgi:hypothetical protein
VRHEAALAELFTGVLGPCRRAGLVAVGVVAVDGTKIAANVSRTANRGYERIAREMLAEAAETDRREDELYGEGRGDELPEWLRTTQGRRAALREARDELERERTRDHDAEAEAPTGAPESVAVELDPARFVSRAHGRRAWLREGRRALEELRALEARPVARSQSERLEESARRLGEELVVERRANAAYEAWRERGVARDGTRRMAPGSGKPYWPPRLPAGEINTTDPDSRLVKTIGQKAVQGYNAQAAVNEQQILVACEVTVESPDFGHLEPMVHATERELARAGAESPGMVIADAGYWRKRQMENVVGRGIQVLIPPDSGLRTSARPGWDGGPYTFMRQVLSTDRRKALYRKRHAMIEPVFGQMKSTDGSTASHAADDRPPGRSGACSAPATTCSSSTTTGQPPSRPNPQPSSQPSAPSDRAPAHATQAPPFPDSHSDMEQTVKGPGLVGWISSRPRAADGLGRRRWIRLTFARRDGMTGYRRELPRSSVAGHRGGGPHRRVEGSPCGWAHPLLETEGRCSRSACFLSGWLVAIAQTNPASSRAQATTIFWWGLPRAAIRRQRLAGAVGSARHARWRRDPGRVGGGRVRNRPRAAGVPGRLDQQAPEVGVVGLRDRSLLAPLAAGALGAHQAGEAHELLGGGGSGEVTHLADDPGAVRCRYRAGSAHSRRVPPRAPARRPGAPRARAPRCAGRPGRAPRGVVEGVLLGFEGERLLGQPAAAGHPPALGRHAALAAQQELRQSAAGAHPVEPGVLAGAHQVARRLQLPRWDPDRLEQPAGVQASEPARVTRVGLDPSPGRERTSPGATTSQAIPRPLRWRYSPNLVGPPRSRRARPASARRHAPPQRGRTARCAHRAAHRRAPPPAAPNSYARPGRRLPSPS